MKNQFNILVILCLFSATSYTQFSRDDFEVCYQACRTNYKTSLKTFADGNGTTQQVLDYLQELFDYEQCVSGISIDDFKTYYATSSNIVDSSGKQIGYCKYFFDTTSSLKYDATEINQSQLQNLVTKCFHPNSEGCEYVPVTGGADEDDGTYHFTQAFESCIETCIHQTIHEDQQLYDIAVTACESQLVVDQTAASDSQTVDNTGMNNYNACLRDSESCGQLYFYDFTDFQYQTYWKACFEPCIDVYNAYITEQSATNNDKVEARQKYFECLKKAPIPDADSFTRLDNTVETGSQILYTSIAVIFALISMLM